MRRGRTGERMFIYHGWSHVNPFVDGCSLSSQFVKISCKSVVLWGNQSYFSSTSVCYKWDCLSSTEVQITIWPMDTVCSGMCYHVDAGCLWCRLAFCAVSRQRPGLGEKAFHVAEVRQYSGIHCCDQYSVCLV